MTRATMLGRPVDAHISSNIGDSLSSAASASFLIERGGWVAGARVYGDMSINIEDCLAFTPRIVHAM